MSDLIAALQIFLKYGDPAWPTWCEHDTLHITEIGYDEVSEEDRQRLDELHFSWCGDGWESTWYGSA